MSLRSDACAAARHRLVEQAEAQRAAERHERLRHYDGARKRMEDLFGIGSDGSPANAWGPGSFVQHQVKRSYETAAERAFEFVVDGLTFRVTETRPRRIALDRALWDGRQALGPVAVEKIKREYPDYGYEVYVNLPLIRPSRVGDVFRKRVGPNTVLRGTDWQRVTSSECLGFALAARGMCCS